MFSFKSFFKSLILKNELAWLQKSNIKETACIKYQVVVVNSCLNFSWEFLYFLELIIFFLNWFESNTKDCFLLCHFLFFTGSFLPILSSTSSLYKFLTLRDSICSARLWYSSELRSRFFVVWLFTIMNGVNKGSGSVTQNYKIDSWFAYSRF